MNIYKEIVRRFPRGIAYSFAYGSGVKQQIGYDDVAKQKSNVIDLTFCVDDAHNWHTENLKKHPSHYSSLRFLGSRFLAFYQDDLPARVYFNTLIPLADLGVTVKYGVISREYLERDLNDWEYLYFAGRLHKPVTDVIPPVNDELRNYLRRNLDSAFMVALLMLPEKFSDFELFHTISNISYKGDFRMIFGENKNKVKNIVEAQLNEFFKWYQPTMRTLSDYVAVGSEMPDNRTFFEQDKSSKATEFYLKMLPANLQNRVRGNSVVKGSYMEVVESIANSDKLPEIILMSVNDIVWRSSIAQSVKNIPTAGVAKSIVYGYRKALKTFN